MNLRTTFRLVVLFTVSFACIGVQGNTAPYGFVGVNTATWDPQLDTKAVAKLLTDAKITMLRFPGGSTSDDFDWSKTPGTSTAQFAHLLSVIHGQATITANYGSGSPQLAAAWVAYSNVLPSSVIALGVDGNGRDWKTAGFWASLRAAKPIPSDDGFNHLRAAHPEPFRFRNWEIGNECYGPWEHDIHKPQHDAVEYAKFVIASGNLMRKVDPKIRIGIVLTDATSPYDTQEAVIDPSSHQRTSEWSSVLLSSLSTHRFRPDFVAFHHYAQEPGTESDAKLFADVNQWPMIVTRLRTLVYDYYRASAKYIGIDCTESNSVAFNPGPQTTGDADARYYSQIAPVALSLGVETLIWWDLHNSENTSGYDTHSALNHFSYGDYGIVGSGKRQNVPYPVYYAIKSFANGSGR